MPSSENPIRRVNGVSPKGTFRTLVCAMALASISAAVGIAQEPAPNTPSPTPAPVTDAQTPLQPQSPDTTPAATLAQRRQDALLQERKNQLTVDTAKLLQLANELKAEMDKSSKDTLSLAVMKKAEQVEKLAHQVRQEMKVTMGN
jgi:hypothetical protein